MAGRTLEDGVAEDGLDGVQTDGAGLRQTEVRAHTQGLSGTVILTERPGRRDKGSACRPTASEITRVSSLTGLRKRVCTLLNGEGTLQKQLQLTETLEYRACSRRLRI